MSDEIEATGCAQDFAGGLGFYHLPEELQDQAFKLDLAFGKIALAVRQREGISYTNPEKAAALERLATAGLKIGSILLSKIPPASLSRLEQEHHGPNIKEVGSTPAEEEGKSETANPWGLTDRQLRKNSKPQKKTRIINPGEEADKKAAADLFRSNAEKALALVDKKVQKGGVMEPAKGQLFVFKNMEMLAKLLEKGIISEEEYGKQEIDRATVVAAFLIRSGSAGGFLDREKVDEGMRIIRNAEDKYLKKLEENAKGPKRYK